MKKLYKENILVIIKKCEFYIKKTDFIGFIIKLGQISIDLKKSISYYRLVRFREYCRSKIIFRILYVARILHQNIWVLHLTPDASLIWVRGNTR